MSTPLPLVIINPAARGGAAARDWSRAVAAVRRELGPFDCVFTTGRGDATRIAEEESRAGRRLLVACGGDGTISEVAGGILRAGADAELGILPQGTGADFLRSLRIPSRLPDAARVLRKGVCQRLDAGRVELTTRDGRTDTCYFINSASFGLSGDVAEHTNRSSKSLGGKLRFALSTASRALVFHPPLIWLQIEEEEPVRLPITIVSFHNGRFFGGGMKMAPEAELADGLLDAVIVRKASTARILTRSPLLYFGAHLGLAEVRHRRLTRARAWADDGARAIPLEVDGECPGVLPARFEILPGALRVRMPPGSRISSPPGPCFP